MILTYIVYILIYIVIGSGLIIGLSDKQFNVVSGLIIIFLVLIWPIILLLLISSIIFRFLFKLIEETN